MKRWLLRGMAACLLGASALPAHTLDPLAMFLIGIARDMVINYANRGPLPPDEQPLPDPKLVYPGTSVEPETLRRLIDDSFTYLSDRQRREIFDKLHAALVDPKNAAVRGAMIEYFAERALMIRAAQRKLSEISWPEKQRIASEFKVAYDAMPREEQLQLAEVVRRGLLPVPGDLGELLAAVVSQ
jgi:hypothetical protein